MEKWKRINGFGGHYEVSSHGRIKSNKRTIYRSDGVPQSYNERILNGWVMNNGYRAITLMNVGQGKQFLVHRLVAEYFVKNPQGKPHVNHKDLNPLNNHFTNLEWVTHYENMQHAKDNGCFDFERTQKGENHGCHKLKKSDVIHIRELYKHGSLNVRDYADRIGVSRVSIYNVIRGKTWRHLL